MFASKQIPPMVTKSSDYGIRQLCLHSLLPAPRLLANNVIVSGFADHH